MDTDLVDRIYEAAFVPELWPQALQAIASETGSASGEFQLLTDAVPPRWQATEVTRPLMDDFMTSGLWRQCTRPAALMALNHSGFLCDHDYMDIDQLAADPAYELLRSIGLGWQLGTLIPMPTGEIVGLTFERWISSGRPEKQEVTRLDGLRPHLARAGLMAARLQLQRARDTVSTLEALGLPAAVITAGGRMRAANRLFEAMDGVFRLRAFDGFAMASQDADRLLREAIDSLSNGDVAPVRSFPVAPVSDAPAAVVHVMPLRRSAHDIFGGSDIIIVATTVAASNLVPAPSLLMGLFDLSPAEAKLASALAAGTSLNEAAKAAAITVKSARTYLERIFAKTGVHRQSELVALLKSASQLS